MKPERIAAASFAVSGAASVGLVVVYVMGGQVQLEGILLGLALGALAVGLAIWSSALLPQDVETEDREPLASPTHEVEGAEDTLSVGEISRRRMLVRMLAGAGGALTAALAVPAFSLGPRPGQSLFATAWTEGVRVVDEAGDPLKATDLVTGSVHTVFPEGHAGSADAQTILVKVEPDLLDMSAEREGWVPKGCIGYSKICTHAGCPVGLYRAESHELLCPCHQSTFDVLRGAEVTFGPADRPLPQLPLGEDDEGYLVALGDFTEPVGPGFWNLTGGGEGA